MDTVSFDKRSDIMSRIGSKNTKMEIAFRKELWHRGIRYRKNPKKYFGKPDIVIIKKKVVIFLDSCFWHGCRMHCRIPKTNREYWRSKVKRNIGRDKEVTKHYQEAGWRVVRIWEHEIAKNFAEAVSALQLC